MFGKKAPSLWRLPELSESVKSVSCQLPSGKWVPARPIGLFGIRHRFSLAWKVFTGQCDALLWPEDDPAEQDIASSLEILVSDDRIAVNLTEIV